MAISLSFLYDHYQFQALAWCPWQPHVLASGGGTADRHIRIWNANTGSCLTAMDTKSQVTIQRPYFVSLA